MWQNQQQPQQSQQQFYYPNPNQQQGYPPQQQGYPPQQHGYAPPPGFVQQAAYPPQHQVHYPPPQQRQQQNPYNPPQQPLNMQQAPYADPEDPEAKGFEFTDQSIRKGFIRKVFSILTVQLLVTFGLVSLFVFEENTQRWVLNNPWLWIVSLVVLFTTLIILACCEGVRRKSPGNFIVLGIFTLAQAFMMGVMSASFERLEVIMAIGITALITISLTIFAFQTKWDFTTMGGVLFVGVIILILMGIFSLIFRSQTLTIVYASLGALVFCIYLVYDIQLMMGGKHKYSISPEEYIFAALNLYVDIVNIFMYILMLIGAARG